MPVLKILAKNDRLVQGNRAGIIVLSAMLYPSDEKRREAYEAAVFQKSMLTENPEAPIPADIARLTFELGGESGITNDALKRFAHGLVAGETLLCVLQLASFVPEHASLRKARRIVKEFRVGPKFEGRLSIPASATPIERAWHNFKRVAHLWAAFIPWWKAAEGNDVLDDDSLPGILADAKWFAEAGANHIPKRARGPILDRGGLWTIPDSPDIPNVSLEPPRMSQIELDWLRGYDSTSRN